jgi:hypothetical protein
MSATCSALYRRKVFTARGEKRVAYKRVGWLVYKSATNRELAEIHLDEDTFRGELVLLRDEPKETIFSEVCR